MLLHSVFLPTAETGPMLGGWKKLQLHGTHLAPCSKMLTIKRSVFVPVLESMNIPMIYLLRFTHRAA